MTAVLLYGIKAGAPHTEDFSICKVSCLTVCSEYSQKPLAFGMVIARASRARCVPLEASLLNHESLWEDFREMMDIVGLSESDQMEVLEESSVMLVDTNGVTDGSLQEVGF